MRKCFYILKTLQLFNLLFFFLWRKGKGNKINWKKNFLALELPKTTIDVFLRGKSEEIKMFS